MQGLFLSETRRLHPAICSFTSELFYEGRLSPLHGLERQHIDVPEPFSGAGRVLRQTVASLELRQLKKFFE